MGSRGIEGHDTLSSIGGDPRRLCVVALANMGLGYQLGLPLDRSILPQVEFFALAGSLAWVQPFVLALGQI